MAKKKIEYDVKLNVEEKVRKMEEQLPTKGKLKGSEQRAYDAAKYNVQKRIKENGLYNESEFKELNTALKNFQKAIVKATASLLAANGFDNRTKTGKALNKVNAQIIAKAAEKDKTIEDRNEYLRASGYKYYYQKNGKNIPISNPDTIQQHADDNSLIVKDSKKQDLADSAEIISKIKSFSAAIEKADQALEKLSEKKDIIINSAPEEDKNKLLQVGTIDKKTDLIVEDTKKEFFGNLQKQQDADDLKHGEDFTSSVKKQETALGKAFKQFTIYTFALRTVKKALQEAARTVQELDKSLTEQAMVTGMSRNQVYGLLKNYQDLAQTVGATTKEVAEAASEFIKQGKTITDALTLSKAAVSAAKVAGVSVGDSINYLTTALNGFKLSANEAMKVSDKFAAVAAASASDYNEIAIALSKVASQAKLAGMSIDYTTALLTTGLEVTREAPETMGTALKTIIARMREMRDYGETLEGDVDVNNVETQLAYIDVKLKDTNGELRDTQDVLDDLGRKWDSLNKNQQAAIAKALAGTRQQSRLIAMMDNYDRVIELQEVAQRSEGATVAQLTQYMRGVEAATNNLQVAWEKFTESIVKSDVVTGLLNGVAGFVSGLSEAIKNGFVMISIGVMLTSMAVALVAKKIVENDIARKRLAIENQQYIITLQRRKQEIEQQVAQEKSLKLAEAMTEESVAQAKIAAATKKIQQGRVAEGEAELQIARQELKVSRDKTKTLQKEISEQVQKSEYGVEYSGILEQLNILQSKNNLLGSTSVVIMGAQVVVTKALNAVKTIAAGVKALSAKVTNKETVATTANTAATKANTVAQLELNAAQKANPIIAIISAVITLVSLIGVLTAGIITLVKWLHKTDLEKTSKKVAELTNNIYELNKGLTGIKKAVSTFDELDSKFVKTAEDSAAMSEALNNAADSLSEKDQEAYKALTTNTQKRQFLVAKEAEMTRELAEKWSQVRKELNGMSDETRRLALTNLSKLTGETLEQASQLQSTIYAMNNQKLYDSIDALTDLTEEEKSAIESTTQSILENLDAQSAWNMSQSNNIETLTRTIAENKDELKVLDSTTATLKEKVEAYENLGEALRYNKDLLQSFNEQYQQYDAFSKMSSSVLDFIDKLNISNSALDDIYNGYKKIKDLDLDITEEQYKDSFQDLMNIFTETGGDAATAIKTVFGDLLAPLEGEQYEKAFNSLISIFDSVAVGINDMGQNLDSFSNKIESFYKKASEWSTMSETDRMAFINDNLDIFGGEDGDRLLKAFETGDYEMIQLALQGNEALQEIYKKRKAEIETAIKIEESRIGSARNEAYIKELKELKAHLEDMNSVFEVSLETRLKQENDSLETYKDYLSEEESALTESLNKRKDAYKNYFNEINQAQEDSDYEEKSSQMMTNLSKIGSTTNAASNMQRADLENQLKELEKDHLEDLRQRAQDAILDNIDSQIDEISKKFDDLLDNNRMMLAALTGDLKNNGSGLISNMIVKQIESGQTANSLSNYVQDLQSTYGYMLPNVDLSKISFKEDNNHNLILNVNGQEVALNTADNQNLYATIVTALRQLGLA